MCIVINENKKPKIMNNLTLTTIGQYASSNKTFTGSKKEVLRHLRSTALEMRMQSRELHRKTKTVHELNTNKHQSELVNMASYEVNRLGFKDLLKLMNAHGVLKFELA